MRIRLEDMYLRSWANANAEWWEKHRIVRAQRDEVWYLHRHELALVTLPATIELVRISPRSLDGQDNLRHAFKHICDVLATAILPELRHANQHGRRGDDSDDRLEWHYSQRKGKPAVEISINDPAADITTTTTEANQ